MKIFGAYLRGQLRAIAAVAGAIFLFCAVGWLYALSLEPFLYAALLSALLGAALLTGGFARYRTRCKAVAALRAHITDNAPALPEPVGGEHGLEGEYRQTLLALARARADLENAARKNRDEQLDYFTIWAHQIKTPLAAMALLLQAEESGPAGPTPVNDLAVELLKTEQYVGMVLGYLRLGESGSDLLLKCQPLDGIIRAVVRRFTRMFLLKKLSLDYAGCGQSAVCDEKWLGFMLEQLLSNAIKYTPAGGRIRITADAGAIRVCDSGIGIRAEDLPRIFEKGYTGANGRLQQQATGLGLYLCAGAAKKTGCTLQAESAPGQGTTITIHLPAAPDYE